MEPIKAGIIGFGRSGCGIHANAIENMPGKFTVTAICDELPDRRKYDAFPNAKACAAAEEVINDPEVELVIVATYNYTHVTPNMFQVVTKLQAAQDPESAAMVDLIIRNRVFDLGYFADLGVTNLVRDSLISERLEIASSLQSGRKAAERSLTKLLANMEKFD